MGRYRRHNKTEIECSRNGESAEGMVNEDNQRLPSMVVRDDSAVGLALRVNAFALLSRFARLKPERRISPTRIVQYVIYFFVGGISILDIMVGRAGFEPATN